MADSRRKTVLCRHFAAGTCRRGSSCSYAHGEAELAKRLCGYFLTPGGCKQGDSCSFSHEFSEAEIQAAETARAERSTDARGKRICRFFLDGRCNKGSSCTFSHDGEEEKTDEAPTAAGDDVASDPESGDIPDSPEVVPAAADGAKSIMKAKVTRVHEEKSLVHLLPDVGDSRVVNLKSFTELWPMPPLCGDRISFPPPAGGPTSRWILPTLEAMASSDGSNGSLDLASNFLKSIQLGYEEQGSSVLMRSDMYCQPYLALLLGTKLARNARSVSLAKRLLDFLQGILPACRGHGSSASEPGLLLKILQSRLWQRETPKLFQYDGIDGFGDGSERSLRDSATSVVNQMLQVVPRYAYLVKPVLLAMMKPQESILQLLNAMSDRLALEDGFFQCATSWRQLPLVPQILSEDLSDLQDLPEVAWMYDGVSDYLDTYFRLLRADCFAPLQKGIRDFLNGSLDPRDMRLFRASAQQFHLVRGSKGLVASMECSNIFNYAVPFPARVLMPSNLVCLSISEAPFAEVLWGRVAERPSDRAAQKKETMVVTIEFLDDLNRIDRSSFISCLLAPPPGGLILAESPVFFLSFGPVLRRLQGLTAGDHGTLPLASCLLGKAMSAEDARQLLPWSDFAMDSLGRAIESGQRVFDDSQRTALEVILTSTLSTIQGPPGTGKSFTGVEAIRHLLKVPSYLLCGVEPEELRGGRGARSLFDSDGSSDESSREEDLHDLLHRPFEKKMRILVLTFKNHALDEFLLDCRKHCPDADIVRIGGRSESEQLKALNLQARAKEKSKGHETGKMLRSLIERKNALKPQIQRALDGLSEKLDPFQLFWQHAPMEQKLSLLDGCPLACGSRPAFQKQRHLQHHEQIRESILLGETFAPDEFRSCFRRWCPSAMSPRPGGGRADAKSAKGKGKEAEISDEEAEEEVKEPQAFQERLEKLCTWSAENLKDVLVYSPGTVSNQRSATGVAGGLSYVEKLWELDEHSRARILGICLRNETSTSWPVVESLCQENDDLQARINELERCHLASVQQADIVGCTISGASIRCDLLADVNFPVVVVEEAAEILEPQLLAALPPSCKQLVLIGDHFQLRPKIQTFQLGRERNFDRSMIERLFAGEANYPKAALKKQNRMRDEFLCLLRPFYPKLLTNHERVMGNDPLSICRKSMFFVTMREHSEVEAAERRSPTNPREAKMILDFTKHILREGYEPQEISILAMYDGQVSLLRNHLRNEGLEQVQCSSVDRYQGDENRFVLISLVRSNDQLKLGFVGERNRLIVAMSRARCGVYIFGNDQLMQEKSKEWKLVLNALEEEGCVGAKLPLMCPRHVELDLEVGQQCHHVCNALLPCGHSCRQPCHREGHHPDCDQEVLVTLPCGHERSCKCSEKEGASEKLKCSKLVDFRHDVCQHPDTRKCWDKKKRCETQVMMCCDRCREESQVPCYIKKDSPENFKCSKPCTRKMSCHHACSLQCYDDCDKGLDDCQLCQAEREKVKEQKLEEIQKALAEMDAPDFTSFDEIQLDGSREHMEVQQHLQAYFPEANWKVTLQQCHRVKNNPLHKRFLQRHQFINCPADSKLLLVEMASEEMAQLAAFGGLAEGLGTRKGKGKGKTIQARHADFFLSSRLERRDVGKNGKWMHLALCRVQCGRVYDLGKPHHTRKLNDKLCDGFDSVYDDEKCCYRLSQANIQLALPLFTMEVFVKIRTSMAEVPLYWNPDVATPFGLVQVTQAERSALKEALRPGGSLGGRDRREDGDYRGFKLKEAWRLEHPGFWGKYAAEKQNMASQLLHISRDLPSPKLRAEMVRATAQLPAELDESLNEVYLSHGTKPESLLNILAGGLNERFSGGLFGNGTYLAEDVAKNDQYCTRDEKYGNYKDLHRHLFDLPKVKHPGDIFYVIFCRVALGHFVRTLDASIDMDDGAGRSVWSKAERELATIKGTQTLHHSLLAETGGRIHRFREFIIFHGDRIYPEYVVAYRRE